MHIPVLGLKSDSSLKKIMKFFFGAQKRINKAETDEYGTRLFRLK